MTRQPTRRAALLSALAGAALLGLPRQLPAQSQALPPGRMDDVALRARDGRPVRWRSDVLRDRIAVVNFVYTTCSSICPPMSAMMAELQRSLAHEPASPVALVSLSVDPLTDTPQRLEHFARAFEPGPRWWWLTGEPGAVFGLLDALGVQTGGDPQSHAPLWLVGAAGRGDWRRLVGLPTLAQMHAAIRELS